MSEPEPAAPEELTIQMPQELFGGVWANFAAVSHSEHEFTIDFIRVDPGQKAGIVTSRVNVSPLFITQLQEALQKNWAEYAKKAMPREVQSNDNDQAVSDGFANRIRAFARSAVSRASVTEAEANYWLASVEGIQGPWGDGATKDEALSELEDAIVAWVEVNLARGAGLPFALTAHFESPKSA